MNKVKSIVSYARYYLPTVMLVLAVVYDRFAGGYWD